MRDGMKSLNYCGAFLLGVLWLLSPLFVSAEIWPIKEVEVMKSNPDPTTWADVQLVWARCQAGTDIEQYCNKVKARYHYEKQIKEVSSATAQEIEKWLHTVAQAYEGMGYRKPYYGDTPMSLGQEKHIVYVFTFYDSDAAYDHICSSKTRTHMKIDSVRSI